MLRRHRRDHGILGTIRNWAWMSPALLCRSTVRHPESWSTSGSNDRRDSRKLVRTPCRIWRRRFGGGHPGRRRLWIPFGCHRAHLEIEWRKRDGLVLGLSMVLKRKDSKVNHIQILFADSIIYPRPSISSQDHRNPPSLFNTPTSLPVSTFPTKKLLKLQSITKSCFCFFYYKIVFFQALFAWP